MGGLLVERETLRLEDPQGAGRLGARLSEASSLKEESMTVGVVILIALLAGLCWLNGKIPEYPDYKGPRR